MREGRGVDGERKGGERGKRRGAGWGDGERRKSEGERERERERESEIDVEKGGGGVFNAQLLVKCVSGRET